MIEFLALYAAAFRGIAMRDADFAKIWLGFIQLPAEDLRAWSADIGLDLAADEIRLWPRWLDAKGVTALRSTLYGSRWAYCTPYENENWFSLSFDAHSVLGLLKPLLRQELPTQLEVDADGLVKAGAGLPIQTLARLATHAPSGLLLIKPESDPWGFIARCRELGFVVK